MPLRAARSPKRGGSPKGGASRSESPKRGEGKRSRMQVRSSKGSYSKGGEVASSSSHRQPPPPPPTPSSRAIPKQDTKKGKSKKGKVAQQDKKENQVRGKDVQQEEGRSFPMVLSVESIACTLAS